VKHHGVQARQCQRHLSPPMRLQQAALLQVPVSIFSDVWTGVYLNQLAEQAERFMWPGFLAKLRESFSLDPVSSTPSLEQTCMVSKMHNAACKSWSLQLC
jgi:hypothetical protein